MVFQLLKRGARVAAVDVRQESLDEAVAAAAVGNQLATFQLDITDRAAVDELPGRVTASLCVADGLINVAGIIQPFVRLADLDDAAIDRVINVNLYGTLNTVRAFLPTLVTRPDAYIANVSSMGGFLPVPGQTIYGATKAAAKLMTEGLYAELLDTNVGVSIIFPKAVATDITTNSGVDAPASADTQAKSYPTTSTEAAAKVIVDGIGTRRFQVFVGKDARMMNLPNRLAPRRSAHMIQKKMQDLLS